jgi:hypothetical protein
MPAAMRDERRRAGRSLRRSRGSAQNARRHIRRSPINQPRRVPTARDAYSGLPPEGVHMKQSFTVTIRLRDRDGNVIGEKQVVKYEGLLARAHEDGLRSIHTELVQIPSKANGDAAIVRAASAPA